MLRKTFSRPIALIVGVSLLLVGGGSAVALAATGPVPAAVELASADGTPTLVLAEGVRAGASGYRPAPEPVAPVPAAPAPEPVAEPVPVVAPTGTLALPGVGFVEAVVEEVEAVDGVLKPHGEGLARAVVPGVRADLLLIHSGRGAAGDLLAPHDGEPTVRAGDPAVLEDGSAGLVLRSEILDKDDFASIPWVREALRDPWSTVLVSCRRDSDSPERSPDNVVIIIGRA